MIKYRIALKTVPDAFSALSGSVTHGILMDFLPPPWPDEMHHSQRQLLSQWIEIRNESEVFWHIGTMYDELGEGVSRCVREGETLFCRHFNENILIGRTEITEIPISKHLSQYFSGPEPPPEIRMFFKTPTTHKSQGEYVLFPSMSLIVGSLRKRIEQADPDCILSDETLASRITEECRIVRYKLSSSPYGLEGVRLTGYTGYADIRIRGEDALRRLAAALLSVAEYTGIGIKTALGMGGCTIYKNQKGEG